MVKLNDFDLTIAMSLLQVDLSAEGHGLGIRRLNVGMGGWELCT